MKRKVIPILLILVLCLSLLPAAASADTLPGLYYQQEGRNGWGPYQSGPICMAPFVDMNAYLISFWDGAEYIPAVGVTSSDNAHG